MLFRSTMANEQLLFSEVRRGVLEPLEVEVPGKGCACSVGVNTGRNVGAWMEVYSDSLTEAGEQQRDKEPLHSVVVAAGRHRVSLTFSTALMLWSCLVLWHLAVRRPLNQATVEGAARSHSLQTLWHSIQLKN